MPHQTPLDLHATQREQELITARILQEKFFGVDKKVEQVRTIIGIMFVHNEQFWALAGKDLLLSAIVPPRSCQKAKVARLQISTFCIVIYRSEASYDCGNRRNCRMSKTLQTQYGEVTVETPSYRDGSFTPKMLLIWEMRL